MFFYITTASSLAARYVNQPNDSRRCMGEKHKDISHPTMQWLYCSSISKNLNTFRRAIKWCFLKKCLISV